MDFTREYTLSDRNHVCDADVNRCYTPAMATREKSKKKSAHKSRAVSKKKARVSAKGTPKKAAAKRETAKKSVRTRSGFAAQREVVGNVVYEPAGRGARAAGQSGDLQGLSDRRRSSSQSVDELLEEGNAFEAEVLKGVEDVEDEEEVRTHEVPEDDVPGE